MANAESRVAELLSVLREEGDDSRASLSVELAALYLGLGRTRLSAEVLIAAARHCIAAGQLLRAAVLARRAFRTNPDSLDVRDQGLEIWRETSGESDQEFFET